MWGSGDNMTDGIIPAYAGNTWFPTGDIHPNEDHPRICGEHMLNIDMMVISSGSSPHMRGTLELKVQKYGQPGIIPAYAGNTG